MEEWIKLRDDGGSGGGGNGTNDGNAIKNLRFAFDLNFQIEKCRFDFCKQSIRSLFDQVVVAFLRDKSAGKCHRPIPALCGDGRPVDLFKLFWLVRKFGGYESVSRNKLWGFISEECGLGCGLIASIKLIYMSYLKELDQWLQQVFSKRVLEDDHCGFIQKLDLLSREVEIRFGGLLPDKKRQEQPEKVIKFEGETNDWDHITISDFASVVNNAAAKTVSEVNEGGTSFSEDCGDTIKSAKKLTAHTNNKVLNYRETTSATATAIEYDGEKSSTCEINGSCISAKKVVKTVNSCKHDFADKATNGEERIRAQPVFNNMIPSKNDVENLPTSRKRKHQTHSFSGMLGWLIQVAKFSDDLSVGSIPECSKWNEYGCADFWAQTLLVREARLIRKHDSKAAGEVLKDQDQLKKPRMNPYMYEDDVINHQTRERLRHSKRIPLTKSHSCPCCKTSAAPHTRDSIHREADVARLRAPSEVAATVFEEKPSYMNNHEPGDVPAEREVSVGCRFQAELPEWTGMASSSDSKWLGTRMWPLEDGERNSTHAIGKGRQHQCDCSYRDSVECVRFHVAEKRFKLKQELGLLFYQWRFNLMGEEVSLSWTDEEENIFKDNMKSYAAFSNKFWNKAWKFLPWKSRDKLVSYYFNVYLVQRRSYQNRVTPDDADSDDDEKGCGSIGGRFGYKTLYMPQSGTISCTLNTESTKFV